MRYEFKNGIAIEFNDGWKHQGWDDCILAVLAFKFDQTSRTISFGVCILNFAFDVDLKKPKLWSPWREVGDE